MKYLILLSCLMMTWNSQGQEFDSQTRMKLAFADISISAGFAKDYSTLASKDYTCLLIGGLQTQIRLGVEKPLEELGSNANRGQTEIANTISGMATRMSAYCGSPNGYENAPRNLNEVRAELLRIKELAFEANRM